MAEMVQLSEIDEDSAEGEYGPAIYLKGFKGAPASKTPDGCATVFEVLKNSVSKFPSRNAIGTREVIKVHQIEDKGKKFEKIELANSFTWLSYEEYGARILGLARGIIVTTSIPAKARMVIYAETQRDWMVAALAGFSMSLEVVTIYATLGEEGALFGINQTKAQVVVADHKLLKVLSKIAPECVHLKQVITIGECDPKMKEVLEGCGKTVLTFDEVVAIGQGAEAASIEERPPQPEDIAVVMYTSGTTGPPKGVLLTHGNIAAGCAGFHHCATNSGLSQDTVFLAYLPLAHIMEMVAEVSIIMLGASMGYGSPHTLTETGVKLKRPESDGDCKVLSPTFMVFAPAVMDKVYKGVTKKVSEAGGVSQWAFNTALDYGMANYDAGGVGVNPLLNLAFSSVQATLGGKIALAVTGSAPLSPEIQKFMQTVLKAPVRQGYGLTENCACATIGTLEDNAVKSVGPPQACAILRIADWPEGLYRNSDKDNPEIGMRRGEVLIGGPTVSQGYLVDPESPDPDIIKKNEEDWVTIQGARYFRTGDIGQITPAGNLMIIDRKKDLWKGPQGEYVALSKVEASVKLSPFVDVPLVYGKTGGEYHIALICVIDGEIRKLGETKGIEGSVADLCKKEEIIADVSASCRQMCLDTKLHEFEIPRKYALIPTIDGVPAWTPENDLLTAAMKLKRPMIQRAHAAEIDALYA